MMNINAYIIYIFLTFIITIYTGLILYRNGLVFIVNMFDGDAATAIVINKVLLTGYYLLNLGYAALMIKNWQTVEDTAALLVSVASMTGRIMFTLAVIHFFNIAILFIASRNKSNLFVHHKTSKS